MLTWFKNQSFISTGQNLPLAPTPITWPFPMDHGYYSTSANTMNLICFSIVKTIQGMQCTLSYKTLFKQNIIF